MLNGLCRRLGCQIISSAALGGGANADAVAAQVAPVAAAHSAQQGAQPLSARAACVAWVVGRDMAALISAAEGGSADLCSAELAPLDHVSTAAMTKLSCAAETSYGGNRGRGHAS